MAQQRSSLSHFLRKLGELVLTRFPFFCALAFTMLCSERESSRRPEGYPHTVIYVHLALLILEGSMMSFATQRSLFALMCAIQAAVMMLVTHTSPSLRFKPWLMIRMLSRDIGVIGTYLIIASRSHEELSRRYRLTKLYPIGRSFLASYFIVLAFQLNQEVIEQKAFIHRVPGGLAVVSLFCIICLISSFMLMSEMKVKTTAQILLVLLLIIIVFVDLDFKYWQGKKVEYWNQITIVGNDVCMLAMLFMLAV
ncbi:uncharacterized protein LOC117293047 [Asterias rubens]|uniref:uncharacterized protein LOC117293047 n=1 Tax=Asterias rubens TaxID=7604 RepID=UPI001455C5BB|nr:uncharacterized protein LOC117293047 [Asterias rubens]